MGGYRAESFKPHFLMANIQNQLAGKPPLGNRTIQIAVSDNFVAMFYYASMSFQVFNRNNLFA